jgi:hypothetical protein
MASADSVTGVQEEMSGEEGQFHFIGYANPDDSAGLPAQPGAGAE